MQHLPYARSFVLSVIFLWGGLAFAQQTLIHCGRLIDGSSDVLRKEMTIVVEGNEIVDVQSGYAKAGKDDVVIDLKDKTVLPGLMDMHVHLENMYNKQAYLKRFTLNEADIAYEAQHHAKLTLMAGFTTVRDLGGTGVNVALRDAIARGRTVGPRVIACRKSLAITGGHADPTNGAKVKLQGDPGPTDGVCNGPSECREAVRWQVKNGADCIKITATGGVLSVARDGSSPQFTEEEINAIVETANDFGIHVAAHAHGAEGMKRAVRAGVRTIEHGTFMDRETMDLMKKHGAWLTPTITAGRAVADSAKIKGYYPDVVTPKALHTGPQIQKTFAVAYKYGVKIVFGTDAGVFPHGLNALEFQYMVEAGMPAMEAIQCATSRAAEMLGEDKLGGIAKGKYADIIAVDGNPLDDVETLMRVRFVMKDGKVFKRE